MRGHQAAEQAALNKSSRVIAATGAALKAAVVVAFRVTATTCLLPGAGWLSRCAPNGCKVADVTADGDGSSRIRLLAMAGEAEHEIPAPVAMMGLITGYWVSQAVGAVALLGGRRLSRQRSAQ
jgi:hypothetical protein